MAIPVSFWSAGLFGLGRRWTRVSALLPGWLSCRYMQGMMGAQAWQHWWLLPALQRLCAFELPHLRALHNRQISGPFLLSPYLPEPSSGLVFAGIAARRPRLCLLGKGGCRFSRLLDVVVGNGPRTGSLEWGLIQRLFRVAILRLWA